MKNEQEPDKHLADAEQVADYLRRHRDFFADRPSLLADMHLVDDTGDAISLIERQIVILRERNTGMRQRINKLLEHARNNGTLFEKSKRLILNLVDAGNPEEIVNALLQGFLNEFGIQHTSLLIYGKDRQILVENSVRILPMHEAKEHLPMLADKHCTICGHLPADARNFIFGARASSSVNSTALVCLNHNSPLGLLAVGHKDAKYFHPGMDTLFLRYIGDVLARLLQKEKTCNIL